MLYVCKYSLSAIAEKFITNLLKHTIAPQYLLILKQSADLQSKLISATWNPRLFGAGVTSSIQVLVSTSGKTRIVYFSDHLDIIAVCTENDVATKNLDTIISY
jgi:hypothetical protein